jgi:hypothetical protein
MFGYDITIKEFLFVCFLIYMAVDTIVFLINGSVNTGPGGCATEDWVSGIFYLNSSKKPPQCEDDTMGEGRTYSTGKWRAYALKNEDGDYNNCLYESQIDTLVDDIKNDYFVEGYTISELFAYIIIPVVTVESIGFWLISSRASKAEWTFWILIITLIYTGLTTLVKETADIDIDPPSQTSCLTYVTDKLGFTTGDELQYTFMGRKQDGTSCMIDGTFLGTPDGGIEPEDQPAIYRGDTPNCSSEELPLY